MDVAQTPVSVRDGWCTPLWICELLPAVDLDPCSNPRSSIRARETYSIERGQDGLHLPWFGLLWLNPPYSDVLPWALKLEREYQRLTGAGVLVNADSSTAWWRILRSVLPMRFDFNKRIRFDPPPGVRTSSNSKPQTLLCDDTFLDACDPALMEHGVLWRRQ